VKPEEMLVGEAKSPKWKIAEDTSTDNLRVSVLAPESCVLSDQSEQIPMQ
jgi:hypothetical protein